MFHKEVLDNDCVAYFFLAFYSSTFLEVSLLNSSIHFTSSDQLVMLIMHFQFVQRMPSDCTTKLILIKKKNHFDQVLMLNL